MNDFEKLKDFIKHILINGSTNIPQEYFPHKLKGVYNNSWECHVLNDLLIIWKEDTFNYEITLVRAGSHSDLFK
ncbi:MAG: type II toxin-antitoxin system YafQ family toxin [Bacteroidales bacterium]|nr:type II toxin-antitoxin system YafQ family toxin [Bacteroidales bacterium]MCF8456929.1 type II toxin-antitoxin system YafQ family toxin [Bacteroidales bacterium]